MKDISLTEEGVKFFEVDRSRWDDLERLFESKGGPSYCWCMVWRPMPKGSSHSDRHAKKEGLRQQVLQGTPVGILGYVEGEPIAWCSIAPRDSYRKLGGPDDQSRDVWSIVCFFVHRRFRAQGMTRRLITAAVDHAKKKGAKVVEAYPVDRDAPSYRFMGFVETFESMGFREIGRAGIRRHAMQLSL